MPLIACTHRRLFSPDVEVTCVVAGCACSTVWTHVYARSAHEHKNNEVESLTCALHIVSSKLEVYTACLCVSCPLRSTVQTIPWAWANCFHCSTCCAQWGYEPCRACAKYSRFTQAAMESVQRLICTDKLLKIVCSLIGTRSSRLPASEGVTDSHRNCFEFGAFCGPRQYCLLQRWEMDSLRAPQDAWCVVGWQTAK